MHVTSAVGCLLAGGLIWLICSISANLVRAHHIARTDAAPFRKTTVLSQSAAPSAGAHGCQLLRVTDETSLDAEFVRQVTESLASVEPNDS
jgi:hypothetical protein